MSLITKYTSTEETIRDLQASLESLKDDPKLKAELEFESKLKSLMAEYSKSLHDVISILGPQSTGSKV